MGLVRASLYTFQSTRPLRGGTGWHNCPLAACLISIHPPLAGRDYPRTPWSRASCYFNPPAPCGAGPRRRPGTSWTTNFNPPAPCGAGLQRQLDEANRKVFQSTRPLRGGTPVHDVRAHLGNISIHPPLAGRDLYHRSPTCCWLAFQSTRPLRGGTCAVFERSENGEFQSTRPLRGGTSTSSGDIYTKIFQSTRPLRGGTCIDPAIGSGLPKISIHPPLAGRDNLENVKMICESNFNPPAPCGAGPR